MSNGILVQELWKLKGKKYDDGNGEAGMEGTYKRYNNALLVWTNGSNSLPDWITNIKAFTYWFGKLAGWHYGFAKVVKKFFNSKKSNELKEEIKKADHIIWAAHSQGCPFASVFIRLFNSVLKNKKLTIVFFGSPNFCYIWVMKKFLKMFKNLTVYSFVNPGDLVPYVPARLVGFKEIKLRNRKRNPVNAHIKYKEDVTYLNITIDV